MGKLVCINGSPRSMSRTGVLIDRIGQAIQRRMPMERTDVGFASVGTAVLSGLDRPSLSPKGDAVCQLVEQADILVIASPVYRGSYSGLLKHLFDMVDRAAMQDKIAILAVTGATPLHGLVLEHQLRPLMGFFGIQTAATALYGLEGDVGLDGMIAAPLVKRLEAAADEIVAIAVAKQSLSARKEICWL